MAGNYQLLIVFMIGVFDANAWYPGEVPIYPVPTECPLEDPKNYTVHIAHESDCTKFYKCFAGEKYEMQCPESWQGGRLHFHKVLQVCAYPKDAGCEIDNPITDSSKSCESNDCGDSSTDSNNSDSKNNSDCGDSSDSTDSSGCGDSSDSKDNNDGKDSSDDKNSSDDIVSSDESSSSGCDDENPCPAGSDGKKIPHECVCNKYYVCKDGDLILQTCQKGKHWSTTRNKCLKAAFAYCVK